MVVVEFLDDAPELVAELVPELVPDVVSEPPELETVAVDEEHSAEDVTTIYSVQSKSPESSRLTIAASGDSILTRITVDMDALEESDQPLCLNMAPESNSLMFQDNTYNFPPHVDPHVDDFMDKVEKDELVGWDRYKSECYKYSMPKLTPIEEVVVGNSATLDFRNYYPQSIGAWLAWETMFLEKCPIETIDVSNSPFTESGCFSLSEFMEQSQTLKYLNMTNCRFPCGVKAMQALEDGLNYMKCMVHLNLTNCNLRDSGGVIVVNAIRMNDTVKILNLSHNQLHSETGKALKELFIRNDVLEELELGWNSLNPFKDCLKPFLDGFKKNVGITRLGLSWNGITSTGEFPDYFKKTIKKNPTLRYLDLQYNRLTGSMDEMAIGFKNCPALHTLDLGGNPFVEADIDIILATFMGATKLKHLALGKYRWLNKAQTQVIQQVKQKHPNLEISYQGTMMSNPPEPVDFKSILINRMRFLSQKTKKAKSRRNMGHFFLDLVKEDVPRITKEEFLTKLKAFGVKADAMVCDQLAVEWQNPKTQKVFVLDMAEYYLTRYPTEPKPPPPPPPPAKQKKGKGGKKDGKAKGEGKEKGTGKGKGKGKK